MAMSSGPGVWPVDQLAESSQAVPFWFHTAFAPRAWPQRTKTVIPSRVVRSAAIGMVMNLS
jgi:hypothetical protein